MYIKSNVRKLYTPKFITIRSQVLVLHTSFHAMLFVAGLCNLSDSGHITFFADATPMWQDELGVIRGSETGYRL